MKHTRTISQWGVCSAVRIPKQAMGVAGFVNGDVLKLYTEPGCIVLTRQKPAQSAPSEENELDMQLRLVTDDLQRTNKKISDSISNCYSILERSDQKDIFS